MLPLKVKLSLDNVDYTFNENGISCCPHDPSLPMKREGSKSHLRSNLPTMKFVCPKMKWNTTAKTSQSDAFVIAIIPAQPLPVAE